LAVRRVIVGVDASVSSSSALQWAVAEAARVGCVLVIVHVARHSTPAFAGRHRPAVPGGDPTLARAVVLAHDRHEPARVQPVLRTGPAADALVELAYADDILVLGAPAPGRRWARASTTHQVIMRASCPVVLVPVASAITGRQVVVGIDRPALAMAALRFGFAFAGRNLLPLTVMLVSEEPRAAENLRSSVEALARRYQQVAVEWLVGHGPAAAVLASASGGAALVVVTVQDNGPGPLVRGLIGQARCPVATTAPVRTR